MKKRLTAVVAGICALSLLGGCASGAISNDNITIKKYKGLEVEKVEQIGNHKAAQQKQCYYQQQELFAILQPMPLAAVVLFKKAFS